MIVGSERGSGVLTMCVNVSHIYGFPLSRFTSSANKLSSLDILDASTSQSLARSALPD